ncbi:hypothetical protein PT974_03057 [Cladobotryum mycophilum]|uniref:DUF1996 domain-containing protein n=1 Tax=Cladobotryum mycophilum TaxID=491253 RepID=A0ABR0SWM5_9HYPO
MPSAKSILAAGLAAVAFQGVDAQLFTANCAPLTVQRADPIVSPGVLSSHVHAVVGGTAFALTLSNDQAKNSKATTCNRVMDNSNYWQPQLYHQRRDGKFELVPLQGSAIYYIQRSCDYAPGRTNCDGAAPPIAPPAGFRMLAGDLNRRTYNDSSFADRATSHMCVNDQSIETNGFPTTPCGYMRSQVFFPSCWNGRDVDSADHKSHVSYTAYGDYNFGVCPQSHPKAIFSVFFEFFYYTSQIKDYNRLVYATGDPTGFSLHGDFLNGWKDQNALNRAMATCTGPRGVDDPGCSINVATPPGQGGPQPIERAPPTEDVGLKNTLDKLPGNNPIRGA